MKYLPLTLLLCTCAPALTLHGQSEYHFDRPDASLVLPASLEEISGLSLIPGKSDRLLAVEDEQGLIYRIDLARGEVVVTSQFHKDGDYEGVQVVGEDVWVVKNTGTLYRVRKAGRSGQSTQKFNTFLTGENDVEGLAYDPAGHRLLLACKRDADDDGRGKDGRYIFAFDLKSLTLTEDAAYAVKESDVKAAINEQGGADRERLLKALTDGDYDLSPSGLAVHPKTGELYLLSGRNRCLLVLDGADGRPLRIVRLSKDLLPQAEGITFLADGTLYISTEAKGGRPGRLHEFRVSK